MQRTKRLNAVKTLEYNFPEFICCYHMSDENEAILSKM